MKTSLMIVRQPLELTSHAIMFDIKVNATGGGKRVKPVRFATASPRRADGLRRATLKPERCRRPWLRYA